MKLKVLWAALCCLLPLTSSAGLRRGYAYQVPIPAATLTAVTPSPTTLSTLVKGSYLYVPASQPGSQVATFTVAGSWSATLHAYIVGADGNTLSLADNLVYNLASGSYGTVPSGTGGSYFVNVPSGGFCLVQTALTTAPSCSAVIGSGLLSTPTATQPVSLPYGPLANLYFESATSSSIAVHGWFQNSSGLQVGSSFSGSVAASGTATSLASLAGSVPSGAVGVYLSFASGSTYHAVYTTSATDFTSNPGNYPTYSADPVCNFWGQVTQ